MLSDYTFTLPKGHAVYMDVKFPLSAYLRYLEAGTDAERQAHRESFLRDVRGGVRELAQRDYASVGDRPSVDYVLLFLPNESVVGFIHEHDPDLVELALGQKVVLCSPLTLFAFLGVIRQAFDNFMIEQTSDEILRLLGRFGQQWGKYKESLPPSSAGSTRCTRSSSSWMVPVAARSSGRSCSSTCCAASAASSSTRPSGRRSEGERPGGEAVRARLPGELGA